MTTDTLTTISSFATAIGVLIAAWQLWRTHRQSITTFEDSLACEYRELAATLPIKALTGPRCDGSMPGSPVSGSEGRRGDRRCRSTGLYSVGSRVHK
jgi:hypothetical protein